MRKPLAHGSRWLMPLAALALLLSGCFRPAGDSIQPTSPPTVNLSDGGQPASNPTATTTGAPAVTLLSPDTSVTTNGGNGSPTSVLPALTEVTVIPFQPTDTSTPIEGTLTPTLQIITPGAALSLVTPDTDTPLPPEGGTPADGSISAQATLPPPNMATLSTSGTLVSGADCTYTVEGGDSLYSIALDNDTTVDALMAANHLQGDNPVLQIGDVLALPDCTPGQPRPTEAATLSNDSTAGPASTPAAVATQDVYTVKPGDTLYGIASKFGVTINAIMRANNLNDPNTLSIGQKLVIPAKSQ